MASIIGIIFFLILIASMILLVLGLAAPHLTLFGPLKNPRRKRLVSLSLYSGLFSFSLIVIFCCENAEKNARAIDYFAPLLFLIIPGYLFYYVIKQVIISSEKIIITKGTNSYIREENTADHSSSNGYQEDPEQYSYEQDQHQAQYEDQQESTAPYKEEFSFDPQDNEIDIDYEEEDEDDIHREPETIVLKAEPIERESDNASVKSFSTAVTRTKIRPETDDEGNILRHKGKNLQKVPVNYTIIKVVTSGFLAASSKIIEIACIKYHNRKPVFVLHTLVNPECDISIEVTETTGINNEMLAQAPLFEQIAGQIWDFLKGECLIGHNVNFDLNFIYDAFHELDGRHLNNDFIDTQKIARTDIKDLNDFSLGGVAGYFNISGLQNQALGDCQIISEILNNLLKLSPQRMKIVKRKAIKYDLRSIKGDPAKADTLHPFYKRNIAFIGELTKLSVPQAAQAIADIGGKVTNTITKKTVYVICGKPSNNQTEKKSFDRQLKKIKDYQEAGQFIQLVNEEEFYKVLRLNHR